MCTSPLKGFILDDGRIIKITKSDVVSVYFTDDKGYVKNYDSEKIRPYHITKFIDIPCRSCLDCYNQIRKEWIARAVAESQLHDQMIFLTLTYDDDKLPLSEFIDPDTGEVFIHATLRYSDYQLFMKRLRKYLKKPIRFMVCGEYGSRTFRPHYHAILFGVGLNDFHEVFEYSHNSHGDMLYTCLELERIWKNGFITVSSANVSTIAYVAGYVVKKQDGFEKRRDLLYSGISPPFIRSSNRPGLGAEWFLEHKDEYIDIYDYKSVPAGYNEDPQKIFLTSNWKRKYEFFSGVRFYDFEGHTYLDPDYELYKSDRRMRLIDPKFDNLKTDMSKEDFNFARDLDLKNKSKRKRGTF